MRRVKTEVIPARHRHPLRGTMLDDFMLRGAIRSISFALRPEVVKDHRGNRDANQDADDAVADFIKIRVGCIALEHAEKKSERDLETGVADAFAPSCDPAGSCGDCGNEHNQRRDRFHMRNKKYDGEKRERAADYATDDS